MAGQVHDVAPEIRSGVERMEHDPKGDPSRELYANHFQIGYNSAEFLFDFGRSLEDARERFLQRIITTPAGAKSLARVLETAITGYEERFGSIRDEE